MNCYHCYHCDHVPRCAPGEEPARCPACGAIQPAPSNAMDKRSRLRVYDLVSFAINGMSFPCEGHLTLKRSRGRRVAS